MVDYRVDVQLVDAINQGEDRAFNSLMMRYQPQVLRVVSRYVRNPSDIMDVMQEVFIKMHQNLHNFRVTVLFIPGCTVLPLTRLKIILYDSGAICLICY